MTSAELAEALTGFKHLNVDVLIKDEGNRFAIYETSHEKPFYSFHKDSRHISESRSDFTQLEKLEMINIWYILKQVNEYMETPLRKRGNDKFFVVELSRNIYHADFLIRLHGANGHGSRQFETGGVVFPEESLFTEAEIKLINPAYWPFAKPVNDKRMLVR